MDKISQHFKKVDPIIYELSKKTGIDKLQSSTDYFHNLCRSICSQQLSIISAAAIFKRFKELLKGELTPKKVLDTKDQKLRKVGFSGTKVSYLKDLAFKINNDEIIFEKFLAMKNAQVIGELTKVKGIGVWTAEMFLMTSLGREDVFSYGDLGLKNSIIKHYKMIKPNKEQLEKLVGKWSPYRTYAARILWKSLNF